MVRMIQKILIANRGEIAVRILHTARKMGIATVAVYSGSDRDALHVRQADETWFLGDGDLSETYLNIQKLIRIAKDTGAQAIHPGYGFLSENADFAKSCEKSGIIFIGPSSGAITLMGNKIRSRDIAKELNIPVTKSFEGEIGKLAKMQKVLPYPILIKAAAGGGGKGMKIVRTPEELKPSLESASREAQNYFSDGTVYIEQYLEEPRHIEVQVLGDHSGNFIHLFERECTIQRRHQKIIEEAPSSITKDEVQSTIINDALKIVKKIGYTNAGTVEFLVDKDMHHYFLEMNTRIQVEHPVTEFITGIDMVELQIRIASGESMPLRQEDIKVKGHAIECRVYAEDPSNNFYPAPGPVRYYEEPQGEGIRIDSSITGPSVIRSEFDPMIAKLVCHGSNREEARAKAVAALESYIIAGTITNIEFLRSILLHPSFIKKTFYTSFLEKHTAEILEGIRLHRSGYPVDAIIAGFLLADFNICFGNNIWCTIGYWRDIMKLSIRVGPTRHTIPISSVSRSFLAFSMDGISHTASLHSLDNGRVEFTLDGRKYRSWTVYEDPGKAGLFTEGTSFVVERMDRLHSEAVAEKKESGAQEPGIVTAPMFGKLTQVLVAENEQVKKGQVLAIVESMKMENLITARKEGKIEKILLKAGQMVETNSIIMKFYLDGDEG